MNKNVSFFARSENDYGLLRQIKTFLIDNNAQLIDNGFVLAGSHEIETYEGINVSGTEDLVEKITTYLSVV